MNDWNLLESRLAAWKPRPPSARVRKQLFGSGEPDGLSVIFHVMGGWRWLVPVMGCFLLVLVLQNPRQGALGLSNSGGGNLLETMTRHQDYSAYITASVHSGQNTPQNDAFERKIHRPADRGVLTAPAPLNTNTLIY